MHGDGELFGVALREVVALQEARQRVAARELNEARRAERVAPFGVVADFGAFEVQHHPGLIEVGLGVRFDLFARERRTGRVAARRIADRGGEVAHEEDHLVPKVLQLAQFIEHHRMPDVNVGSRGVQPQLAAKRLTRRFGARELLFELLFDEERVGTAADQRHRLTDLVRDGKLLVSHFVLYPGLAAWRGRIVEPPAAVHAL